jgi:hypothetical protein
MDTCSECGYYYPIDANSGKCKKSHAERHIKPTDGCVTEIVNGWPIVIGSEDACGEAEL